jgi:hypothetical protein
VKSKINRLMKTGIIAKDREHYRYVPPRELTPDEKRRFEGFRARSKSCAPVCQRAGWTADGLEMSRSTGQPDPDLQYSVD